MAALSDQLLGAAIFAYLLAMVCYAAGYAIAARTPSTPAMTATMTLPTAAVPALASLGATTATHIPATPIPTTHIPAPARPAPATIPGWTRRLNTAALAASRAGALIQAGCLAARGAAAHRVPWGNMYEFVIAATLVASVAWCLIAVRRRSVRPAGLLVSMLLVVLLGLDGMVLYTRVAPLVPALNSYWLKIHVTLAVTASGVFLVGFATTVAYLLRTGHDRRIAADTPAGFPYSLAVRLPAAASLERLMFRLHAFAFPLWTLPVICGAIWAEAAWGRYWGLDPKETWSFIAWVIYAGYLHARATPSVKRGVVAAIAAAGWAAMMVNLFVVNIVIAGLHSYAGVK